MPLDKDKGVVDFGAESDYSSRIAAVKAKVGKAPTQPLPRLDQNPAASQPNISAMAAAKKILSPEQQKQLQEHGSFVPGVGSAYTANQPSMESRPSAGPEAGQPEGWANPPRAPGSGLRPETLEQLKGVAEANNPVKAEEVDKIVDEIDDIDAQYETNEYGNRVRSLISNKERREAIEKRCTPMDVDDLLLTGEVRQVVPILPGKIEPTYRSVSGDEDQFIKQLMSGERGSEQYIMDRYSLLNLTAGLYALNGRVLPPHLDKNGDPTKELFTAKLKVVAKYAYLLLADLSVNYVWFTRRVQRLMVVDNIKGF